MCVQVFSPLIYNSGIILFATNNLRDNNFSLISRRLTRHIVRLPFGKHCTLKSKTTGDTIKRRQCVRKQRIDRSSFFACS